MVCHEDIGMDGAFCEVSVFGQPVSIKKIIIVVEETRLSVISTLNYVKRNIWKNNSWASWHLLKLSWAGAGDKQNRGLSHICPYRPKTRCAKSDYHVKY